MEHWYAIYNTYGNRTKMRGSEVGRVHVFDTERERDEWVEADVFVDGDFHREAIGSREARRLMAARLSRLSPFTDFWSMGTDELAEAYRSWR